MTALVVLAGVVGGVLATLIVTDLRTGGGVRQVLADTGRAPAPGASPEVRGIDGTMVAGVDPGGATLELTLSGPTLLAFVGSTCTDCRGLWSGADRAQRRERGVRLFSSHAARTASAPRWSRPSRRVRFRS